MAERTVAAATFKAQCLKLMDQVARERRPLVVTKRGRPVVRITPVKDKPRKLFGYMAGTGEILGDIVAPTGEEWEADR